MLNGLRLVRELGGGYVDANWVPNDDDVALAMALDNELESIKGTDLYDVLSDIFKGDS